MFERLFDLMAPLLGALEVHVVGICISVLRWYKRIFEATSYVDVSVLTP